MRYALVVLSLFLCSSCLGEEVPADAGNNINLEAHDKGTLVSTLWVCHHPGSRFHNQRCVDEIYPDGCYVDGDSHKFCWLLSRKECNEETEYEAIQACGLFRQADLQAHPNESH